MLQITDLSNKTVAIVGELIPSLDKSDLVSLCDADSIFFFGKKKAKDDLFDKLKKIESYSKPKIFEFVVSEKKKDNYAWKIFSLLKTKKGIKFDFIIYKGNHSFDIDGSAIPLVIKALNSGGMIAIADSNWSIAKSPTMNPKVNPKVKNEYPDEQINFCPIKELISFYFIEELVELKTDKSNIRIFKKI